MKTDKIVFFDGYCGLCNGFVDFVIKNDKKKQFFFSPLQSEFALHHLPSKYTNDLKSIVVQINGKTYVKTEAVFKVLEEFGGSWKVISKLKLLPDSLLDFGYDVVATNRYRMFGKKELCRLPKPEEKQRFVL